jgi:hypothetical protein
MKKDVKIVGPANDAPVSTALVLASKPAGAGDELATLVASLTNEYSNLDSEIHDLTDELLGQERKLSVRYRDELLPRINQMQMLLSQRGALRELVANDRSLLGAFAQLDDMPTWTEWYEAFASNFQGAKSLRQVQRQLKKIRGETRPKADDDTSSTIHNSDGSTEETSSDPDLYRNDEGKSAADLLAEHAKKLLDVLTGPSVMSDGMRITRAVSLVKDLQRALEEGFLVVSAPVSTPTVTVIEGEIVPDETPEPALSKPSSTGSAMAANAIVLPARRAVAALPTSAGARGVEDARGNPVLSDVVSPSSAESLAEDNLPAHSAGPVTLGFLPYGEAIPKQLVHGRKYKVRPAPSGGYGIYEGRSPVLVQWFAEEDDAWNVIDRVSASVLVA